MQKLFMLLMLLLSANAQASEINLTIKLASYVKHHKAKSKGTWNEGFNNYTIAFESIKQKSNLEYGYGFAIVPLNSYRKTSVNAHGIARYCGKFDAVKFCSGGGFGITTGYGHLIKSPIAPFAVWTNKIQYKKYGLEHNKAPSFKNHVGFDSIMATYDAKIDLNKYLTKLGL